jgi:hypothetical protein
MWMLEKDYVDVKTRTPDLLFCKPPITPASPASGLIYFVLVLPTAPYLLIGAG